jgi:hypothetical protein
MVTSRRRQEQLVKRKSSYGPLRVRGRSQVGLSAKGARDEGEKARKTSRIVVDRKAPIDVFRQHLDNLL